MEDDELIRVLASEALHDEGFEVVEAEHGDAAASVLDAAAPFDAICTDVRMRWTESTWPCWRGKNTPQSR